MKRSDLSPDQLHVYESLLDWIRTPNSHILTLGGFAGTGKSTLLGLFASETKLKVAYICFTGRASSVLARKLHDAGVSTTSRAQSDDDKKLSGRWGHLFYTAGSAESRRPFCGTIHRLIYRPIIDEREELTGWAPREELDRPYDLIVVDEASMIDARIIEDLQAHGVRILAVGDHGQLPPVRSSGSLMMNPQLRLEKIHRQAEGSPIIQLSRVLREEGRIDRSLADGQRLVFGGDVRYLSGPWLDTAVLCWRNKTRVNVNRSIRQHAGLAGRPPQAHEPLIALRNYPPVYNGMRGILTEATTQPYQDKWWIMQAKMEFPDEGIPEATHMICRDQFHRHETFRSVDEMRAIGMEVDRMSEGGRLMDFGYAMTVHKSQGSQFHHAVVVMDWAQDYSNEDRRRLAYTAITRASERLTLIG